MDKSYYTKDNVLFCWGMTLVNESGHHFKVPEEEYEFIFHGTCRWIKSRPKAGHRFKFNPRHFYSSQEARIKQQISQLNLLRREINEEIDKEIADVIAGGKGGKYMLDSYQILKY